jgi:AcrR family transcriptional regulator
VSRIAIVPRPRTHDDALRARLLEEAGREISEHGAGALSLRRVASAAGTSTTAVYSLFGGRAELLAAVFDEAFRRFGTHLAAVVPGDDVREDLVALARAYRASARAEPHFYGVMFGAASVGVAPSNESVAAALTTFAPLIDLVRRGIDDGVLVDEDPLRIAAALWASVHGYSSLELAGLLPPGTGSDEAFAAGTRAAVDGWTTAQARSAGHVAPGHIAPN